MNVIDEKLIEAWTVMTLVEDTIENTILQSMQIAGVPEKYKREVEVKVAQKRIEKLNL